MGLADCRCGPINCSQRVSVVHNKSRPRPISNVFASKGLAFSLIALLVVHSYSLAQSKKIHVGTHPDHSDHDDYDDSDDRDSPDLPAGPRTAYDHWTPPDLDPMFGVGRPGSGTRPRQRPPDDVDPMYGVGGPNSGTRPRQRPPDDVDPMFGVGRPGSGTRPRHRPPDDLDPMFGVGRPGRRPKFGQGPRRGDPDHPDDDDDESAGSRSDLPAPVASSKSDGVALKPGTTTAKPMPVSTTAKSDDLTKGIAKDNLKDAAKAANNATKMAKTRSPKKIELENAIKSLGSEAKKVEAKKNNTIIINGRRFDQVNPIECVDEQFYAMLMKDLSLINPAVTHDEYETYFDSERAMAISAIVDAPATKRNSAFGRQLELAAGKDGDKLVDVVAGSGTSRAALPGPESGDDQFDKDMTSQQLIREIQEFWRETNRTYSETSRKLNLKFKRRKRAARKQPYTSRAPQDGATTTSPKPKSTSTTRTTITTTKTKGTTTTRAAATTTKAKSTTTTKAATTAPTTAKVKGTAKPGGTTPEPLPPVMVTSRPVSAKPNYRKALENHYYLMRRLEELKSMLLNGEEALIVMNNRVKKLQQAVGENELKRALCSCITSRGGRAALMLISELFTDKNALKMLGQLDQAKHKAELAARDTAEFCAYWYGDTLRSQAIIKEKQIKRLIVKIKGEYERHTRKEITTNTTITTTSVSYVKDGNSTKKVIRRETRIRVVSKVVEMTQLWRPELTLWIQNELGPDFVKEIGSGNCNSNSKRQKRRAQSDSDEVFMSTPFDQSSLYLDIDDGEDFETSAILQSFVANNFQPALMRGRRAAGSTTTRRPQKASTTTKTKAASSTTRKAASSTTRKTASSTTMKGPISTTTRASGSTTRKASSSTTTKASSSTTKRAAGSTTRKAPGSVTSAKPTSSNVNPPTGKPPAKSTTTSAPNKPTSNGTANFEDRVSRSANKCARDGFAVLLDIAYDENAILYEASRIKRGDKYIETLRESFITSFAGFWVEKRNEWSRKFTANNKNLTQTPFGCPAGSQAYMSASSAKVTHSKVTSNLKVSSSGQSTKAIEQAVESSPSPIGAHLSQSISVLAVQNKSVDDLIDDALEPTGNAYERGARLGYTIGKFIGEKAARQWPDPVELNTFTYDSLFLAGVGHNFDAQQTRRLEDLIVTETAKRVAFTEASRMAFAKALHTAYLNGAFVVPEFGVLHGQRAISKRAATEGAQVGFAAAYKSAAEFGPAAVKFFTLHEHQRSLAEPYKKSAGDMSAAAAGASNATKAEANKKSLAGRIDEVRVESELNANITRVTLECGQRAGAIMGALVGLLVTPEAFETYGRVRGSLEAVEGEFYRYKLGALRGYELGESWAILNYTNAMAKRLDSFRADIGRSDLIGPGSSPAARSTTTVKPPLAASKKPDKSGGKHKGNATHVPDDKMLSTVADTDPRKTNMNNVFQFMVVNYGERLVANHSKGSMLTFRALVALDEATLNEMKTQSGDMVEVTNATHKDEDEDIFETVKVAGELSGSLGSVESNSKKFPLKLEILDLGPIIEFSDGAKSANRSNSFEAVPLTEALSKVNKIYVKLRVARQSGSSVNMAQAADVLEAYLNNDQTDGGDGFMCGSYSSMGSSPKWMANDTKPRETQDELALEAAILDELYERIENLKLGQDAVAATEALLKVTTAAPSRVTPLGSSTTSPSTTPRLNITTTGAPTGGNRTTPAMSRPSTTPTTKGATTSSTTKRPATASTTNRATTTSTTSRATTSMTTKRATIPSTTKRATTTSTTEKATTKLATKAASKSRASLDADFDATEAEADFDSDSNSDSDSDSDLDLDLDADSRFGSLSEDVDSGEQEVDED